MSQQINLYNPALRKRGFSFTSATAMAYGVGLAVAVGALGAAYESHRLREARAEAQAVEQTHKDAVARVESLTAELGNLKPNPQLEAEIAALDIQLKGRHAIIERLKSGALGNTSGYSDYMRAFSHRGAEGLWLTGFDIARGGEALAIRGRAVSADLVAGYLKGLSAEKPLQGLQFAALRIARPTPDAAKQPSAAAPGDAAAPALAVPRYLEFVISTGDLADVVGAAVTPAPEQPLLGAIADRTPSQAAKAGSGQEAVR